MEAGVAIGLFTAGDNDAGGFDPGVSLEVMPLRQVHSDRRGRLMPIPAQERLGAETARETPCGDDAAGSIDGAAAFRRCDRCGHLAPSRDA
jgi:hypothetical protein